MDKDHIIELMQKEIDELWDALNKSDTIRFKYIEEKSILQDHNKKMKELLTKIEYVDESCKFCGAWKHYEDEDYVDGHYADCEWKKEMKV